MELKIINNIDEMTPSEQEKFIGGKVENMWLGNGTRLVVRGIPEDRRKKNVNEQASIIYIKDNIHHHTIYGNAILVMNEVNNEEEFMATEYIIFEMDVEILAENSNSWLDINNAEDLRICEAFGICKRIMTATNEESLDGALAALYITNQSDQYAYGFIKKKTGE